MLASVTLDAGVINPNFFTSIVLLSILTSQLAGLWLDQRRSALAEQAAAADEAGARPEDNLRQRWRPDDQPAARTHTL